jgi:hypothetical protein
LLLAAAGVAALLAAVADRGDLEQIQDYLFFPELQSL